MNWTSRDEKHHAELQAELAELAEKRAKAWNRLHEVVQKCYDPDLEGVSVDLLILYADDMRDALAPFDSGIRVAEQS